MSDRFIPVTWNRTKWAYDAALILAIFVYLWAFIQIGSFWADATRPVDGAILRMRAFGSCAFFLLTLILCIGPLARLDARFMPLLYNRRHFGVITAVVAATHVRHVLGWYYAFSPTNQFEALLASNTSFWLILGFPFELLGLFALVVLAIMAFTSHDFWLEFLGPPLWKGLHLLVYPAYAAVAGHVMLGYLQDTANPGFAIVFALGLLTVTGLHIAAWRAGRGEARAAAAAWVPVGAPEEIPEGRARIVRLPDGDRAAVFRHQGRLVAVTNACAHQNGPLGEGRILDGCITCPWHGFQYRFEDGIAPPPFTEKLPTYALRLNAGRVEIASTPNPPGEPAGPIDLSAEAA